MFHVGSGFRSSLRSGIAACAILVCSSVGALATPTCHSDDGAAQDQFPNIFKGYSTYCAGANYGSGNGAGNSSGNGSGNPSSGSPPDTTLTNPIVDTGSSGGNPPSGGGGSNPSSGGGGNNPSSGGGIPSSGTPDSGAPSGSGTGPTGGGPSSGGSPLPGGGNPIIGGGPGLPPDGGPGSPPGGGTQPPGGGTQPPGGGTQPPGGGTPTSVPEPATLALFGFSALSLLALRRSTRGRLARIRA